MASYQQALQAIQAGHFETAIAQLDQLLQIDATSADVWQAKAVAALSLGQVNVAIAAATQAIQRQPALAPAHRLLGRAYRQLGETSKAMAAYKQAMRCYLALADKTNAGACLDQIEHLQAALASGPGHPLISPQAFLEQTTAKLRQGRHREALEDLNWLLTFEPDHAIALAQRGLVHGLCHDYQRAVQDMARAIALAPDNPALRLQRGQLRLRLGDAHGAMMDFTHLLQTHRLDPAQVYRWRGQAYQALNDSENAFKDFSNALGLDPNNASCYEGRGDIYQTMGDLGEALANYRQAASLLLDQGDWSAHQALQQKIRAIDAPHQVQAVAAARIIRVPIKYLIGGAPVIDVLFNTHYQFEMILDTGAGMTVLTQHMAYLLNVVSTGTRRFQLADGRMVQTPVGIVESIAVDQARASRLEVAISPTAADGWLGQNYLWRYDVRILRTEVELHGR